MKIIILGCLVLFVSVTTVVAFAMEERPPKRSISVQHKKSIFLGESLKLNVSYRNEDTKPWRLQQPDTSRGVYAPYIEIGSNPKNSSAHILGKMRAVSWTMSNGEKVTGHAIDPPSEITIEPGASYSFEVEITPNGGGSVDVPGIWEIWIEDRNEKLHSPHVKIEVLFGPESVPLLVAIGAAAPDNSGMRGWAVRWLRQLKPDLVTKGPDPGVETEAEAIARRAENVKAFQAFREFWEKEKDSDAIKQKFAQINEKAKEKAEKTNTPPPQPAEK